MSANKNFLFVNNIFIGNGPVVHGPSSGEKFIGNVWWKAGEDITFRDHKDLIEWSAATGQEKLNGEIAGRQIDPKLKGPFITTITDPYQLQSLTGYSLKPESPVKDLTLDLASLHIPPAPHDFFNGPVFQQSNPGLQQIERNQ